MTYGDYSLEILFRTIFHMHMNCVKKEFDKNDLQSASHPQILFMLAHGSENRASQKEIADRLGVSAPTVAVSVKRMEKAGLVRKVADEKDLRRNLIALTDQGHRVVQESHVVFHAIEKGMFQGFSEREQEQLKTLFLRIVSNLESMGATPPEFLKKGHPDWKKVFNIPEEGNER